MTYCLFVVVFDSCFVDTKNGVRFTSDMATEHDVNLTSFGMCDMDRFL